MKPRLYDPRTGYRVDARGHRALMKYADRQIARYDTAAQDAADHAEQLRRRSSRVAWMRKAERAADRRREWKAFRTALTDQLVVRVEYEAKFAYTGKKKEHNRERANLNIRMRYRGRLPLPTDLDVKKAFYNLLLHARAPRGWEYAICDWRNDRRADTGWHRGSWRSGGRGPDTEGQGALATERADAGSLDWTANMVVHAALHDFDTLVIGEVEE